MSEMTAEQTERATRTIYWQDECRYVSDTWDCHGGRVIEMSNDPQTFLRYARMQRDQAASEGFTDSATYIQHVIDDMESRLKKKEGP